MTVRIGIVGLGSIGMYHARQLETHAPDVGSELVGGMDIAAGARDRFQAEYDVPAFASVDDLVERCDAMIVTVPNQYHEDHAVKALEAGLDVLIEKPLAHTVASAERIAKAAADADGFCMVGFQSRFANPVEVLKASIEADRFGEIYHVECNYVRRRGVPGLGSWFTDDDMAGGGALIDVGVHVLDLGLHVLSFPGVLEVSGTARSLFGGREDYAYLSMWGEDGDGTFDVEDSVSAFVRCSDGRSLSLEVAWAANRPPDHRLIVHGTDGGAVYDLQDGTLTFYESSRQGGDHHADTAIETRDGDPHLAEKRRFVRAVREGVPPTRNTVSQALTVQRVVDGIYQSSTAARAVEL